jgi:ElaB/YqjD/DUF883 family membrane-anchored ribosome-binding protein
MQLHKKPTTRTPHTQQLQKLVRGFQLLTMSLQRELQTNPVVSDDERESIRSNCEDMIETLTEVLSRTVQSLDEGSSEFARMNDIELGTKFDRQQPEILFLVDCATSMLERLFNLQHITPREYKVLGRYFRSLPVQHQLLSKRWERARNT